MEPHIPSSHHGWKNFNLVAGPVLSLLILFFLDLDPSKHSVTSMAAVAFLMAFWWITEAVPLEITSLLPIFLFPALGLISGKHTASMYANDIIFLFLGGFFLALAIEKWNLHKRIALKTILWVGLSPSRLLFGFMSASAFLSMWVSNTATAMMMIPIALAILSKLEEILPPEERKKMTYALLLGVAYSASVGGMATLIGTPPNMAFARIYQIQFPQAEKISFLSWMFFGIPLSLGLWLMIWALLSFVFFPCRQSFTMDSFSLEEEYKKCGPLSWEEKWILGVFASMALLWMTRGEIVIGDYSLFGWAHFFPQPQYIDDGTVAIGMALLLFLIPSHQSPSGRIMDWKSTLHLPWGIILLFGGGFALAEGFKISGLSSWVGGNITGLKILSPLLLTLSICLIITFLTELTSNTATTQMILPILASIAVSLKIDPLLLMLPATISASCAFMLPVATPPNAVVFSSGKVPIAVMAKTGFWINILGAFWITFAMFFLRML